MLRTIIHYSANLPSLELDVNEILRTTLVFLRKHYRGTWLTNESILQHSFSVIMALKKF